MRDADRNGPFFAVWDRASGGYINAPEDRCVARWAGGALNRWGVIDHSPGEICARIGTDRVDDAPLCAHHFKRAMSWLDDERSRESYESEIEFEHELARERDLRAWPQTEIEARERAVRKREAQLERIELSLDRTLADLGVIYYIRRTSDGLIKIGTSRQLVQRMHSLRSEHGEIRLLLAHPGTYGREGELHEQFRDLRVQGEWFRPDKPLLNWIVEQRALDSAITTAVAAPVTEILKLAASFAA